MKLKKDGTPDRRGQNPNSLKNLNPFPPGTNGYNPGTMSLRERIQHRLQLPVGDKPAPLTQADELAQSMIDGAILREPTPLTQVCDRVDGKVTIPISGADGKPLEIIVRWDGHSNAASGTPPATPL